MLDDEATYLAAATVMRLKEEPLKGAVGKLCRYALESPNRVYCRRLRRIRASRYRAVTLTEQVSEPEVVPTERPGAHKHVVIHAGVFCSSRHAARWYVHVAVVLGQPKRR